MNIRTSQRRTRYSVRERAKEFWHDLNENLDKSSRINESDINEIIAKASIPALLVMSSRNKEEKNGYGARFYTGWLNSVINFSFKHDCKDCLKRVFDKNFDYDNALNPYLTLINTRTNCKNFKIEDLSEQVHSTLIYDHAHTDAQRKWLEHSCRKISAYYDKLTPKDYPLNEEIFNGIDLEITKQELQQAN